MSERSSMVAIDVGNTAVKLCFADVKRSEGDVKRSEGDVKRSEGDVKRSEGDRDASSTSNTMPCHIVSIVGSTWHLEAAAWIRDQLGGDRCLCRIASVRDGAADQLQRAIASEVPTASVHRVRYADVPMTVEVDHPDRLGIDRLVGAFAAWNRFQRALVVVDVGSAITVDWVSSSGCFFGGAILPGLRLQAQALARGTDALPEIDWQGVEWPMQEQVKRKSSVVPAANTEDAIRLGVLIGAAAAIDRLAEGYLSTQQISPAAPQSGPVELGPVVVTGGDGPLVSKYLKLNHDFIPNLVCAGLLEIPHPNSGQISFSDPLGRTRIH